MINLIKSTLLHLINYLVNLLKLLFDFLINHFSNSNIFEKIIICMTAPAFFAVVLPIAKYYIFESYMTINNPLAVYLIGIVSLMLISQFVSTIMALIFRCCATVAYLFTFVYSHITHEISKAPYEVVYGYYINIIVILIYLILSIFSYIIFRNHD